MMTLAMVTKKKRSCFASKTHGGDSCTSMNGIDGFSTASKKLRTTLCGRSEITMPNESSTVVDMSLVKNSSQNSSFIF